MESTYLLTKLKEKQWYRLKVFGNVWKGGNLSVSTSFWGLVYNILPEIGLFKNMNLDKQLHYLKNKKLIQLNDDGLIGLTKEGLIVKEDYENKHYVAKNLEINLEYDLLAFKDIFLLTNQTISEISYENKKFYPYQIDLNNQWQVKGWLKKYNRDYLISNWYKELKYWLETLKQEEALLFVELIFGHKMSSKLIKNLDVNKNWQQFDINLWQLDKLADLIKFFNQKESVIGNLTLLTKRNLLSNSAIQSIDLINKNYSIDKIANLRKIKQSTVREHLLYAIIYQMWKPTQIKTLIPKEELNKLSNLFKDDKFSLWDYQLYNSGKEPIYFTYFRLYQLIKLYEVKNE